MTRKTVLSRVRLKKNAPIAALAKPMSTASSTNGRKSRKTPKRPITVLTARVPSSFTGRTGYRSALADGRSTTLGPFGVHSSDRCGLSIRIARP